MTGICISRVIGVVILEIPIGVIVDIVVINADAILWIPVITIDAVNFDTNAIVNNLPHLGGSIYTCFFVCSCYSYCRIMSMDINWYLFKAM